MDSTCSRLQRASNVRYRVGAWRSFVGGAPRVATHGASNVRRSRVKAQPCPVLSCRSDAWHTTGTRHVRACMHNGALRRALRRAAVCARAALPAMVPRTCFRHSPSSSVLPAAVLSMTSTRNPAPNSTPLNAKAGFAAARSLRAAVGLAAAVSLPPARMAALCDWSGWCGSALASAAARSWPRTARTGLCGRCGCWVERPQRAAAATSRSSHTGPRVAGAPGVRALILRGGTSPTAVLTVVRLVLRLCSWPFNRRFRRNSRHECAGAGVNGVGQVAKGARRARRNNARVRQNATVTGPPETSYSRGHDRLRVTDHGDFICSASLMVADATTGYSLRPHNVRG